MSDMILGDVTEEEALAFSSDDRKIWSAYCRPPIRGMQDFLTWLNRRRADRRDPRLLILTPDEAHDLFSDMTTEVAASFCSKCDPMAEEQGMSLAGELYGVPVYIALHHGPT